MYLQINFPIAFLLSTQNYVMYPFGSPTMSTSLSSSEFSSLDLTMSSEDTLLNMPSDFFSSKEYVENERFEFCVVSIDWFGLVETFREKSTGSEICSWLVIGNDF